MITSLLIANRAEIACRLIRTARRLGSRTVAIHPGHGFLSENADLAQAMIDERVIWVGLKPAGVRAMWLKDAAKKRMEAGVPVTPGHRGRPQGDRQCGI